MGFPPLPAPVSLVTAIPCPPVALFGAHCAMSLEARMPPLALPSVSLGAFTFRAPTIDLARSSWQLFVVCRGLALSAMISSDIETVEGVPTTNSQSETSRRKQCESVSKKSGVLNLSLYHLERNVHPGTEIVVSFGLSSSSVSSDIAYLTFPWGCHLWPCLLFFLGFFFRSSRLVIEHLNWMAPGALS